MLIAGQVAYDPGSSFGRTQCPTQQVLARVVVDDGDVLGHLVGGQACKGLSVQADGGPAQHSANLWGPFGNIGLAFVWLNCTA